MQETRRGFAQRRVVGGSLTSENTLDRFAASCILVLFLDEGGDMATWRAVVGVTAFVVVAFGAPAASAAPASQRGLAWPRLKSYLSRELACVESKTDIGRHLTKRTFNCDFHKGGLHWIDIHLSRDQRSVRAVQTFVVLKTEDRRVPTWQPPLARRSVLRLARFMVPDDGQSARWIDLAFHRTLAGRCFQAHHSRGYSIATVSISPVDLAIINVELTIAHGPSANPYLEDECFP